MNKLGDITKLSDETLMKWEEIKTKNICDLTKMTVPYKTSIVLRVRTRKDDAGAAKKPSIPGTRIICE